MIQLKVYKTKGVTDTALFLDLYETEPIKLTLSIEDITQADATSVFSKTFRVPSTRNNNEFFENAFEIDGIDFDVTLKNQAEILVDGAEFRQGHIRLQKIFRNQDLDKIDYELLFLGETRDFSSVIAEKTMCQINMTDFQWEDSEGNAYVNYTDAADYFGPFNKTNIVQSWGAFPENASLTGGFADGNLLFPLINHGNTYDDDNDSLEPRIALGTPSDMSFTNSNRFLAVERMKPMIRAKRVWDQIFEDAGYTYTSDFLTSPRFHQMYVSAFGNTESISMDINQVTGNIFTSSNIQNNGANNVGDFQYMWNPSVTGNVSGAFSVGSPITGGGSFFTVGLASTNEKYYIFSASAFMDAEGETNYGERFDIPCILQLVHIAGGVETVLAQSNVAYNGNQASLTYDSRGGIGIPGAGVIKVKMRPASANAPVEQSQVNNSYFDCTAAPGDYYAPYDLDCEYKQIDYIKDILTSFRLVMQPDNKRPNNFIIEPWQEFIGSGVTYDWSDKLVEQQDSVLEPLFNTQSATIEFSKTEDDDFINKFHQDNNKHPYGWLRFSSNNELLKGSRKIEVTGIAPTPIDQIDYTEAQNQQENPRWVIPSIYELTGDVSSTGYPNQHAIKSKTRLLFYNGKQTGDPDTALPNADRWYLADNNPIDFWPLVSPYENWPVEQTSLNLNFSNDTRYYIDPNPGSLYFDQGSTLFDEYWSRYISSLYNKYSRRLTAKFILNNVDLQDLTFDDVIFVNGKYYRPEKIIDAQVGAETVVTCQLITLNDQRPQWLDVPLSGFSVAFSNDNCIGEQGNIQVTTQGTPAFTWELSAGGAQGNVNPPLLPAGSSYTFEITAPVGIDTLTVTDSVGRVAVVQVNVPASQATQVTSTFTKVDPTVCSGSAAACNGSVTVVAAGGVGPYTLDWLDTGNPSFNRTGMCEGTYQYVVYDANGCPSDTYTVVLECDDLQTNWNVQLLSADCDLVGPLLTVTIPDTVTIDPTNTVITLNETGNCYMVLSETTNAANYTYLADFFECEICQDQLGPANNSWYVENCDDATFTYIPNNTPVQLQPGFVVKVTIGGVTGCYEVMYESTTAPTDTFGQVYDDCTSCDVPGYGYYAYACDTSSFPPTYFQSTTQLAGTVFKISTGPYTGTCVSIIRTENNPSGEYLDPFAYTDCDDCQGITPPPTQTCVEIYTSIAPASGTYIFNGSSFTWSLGSQSATSVCAEANSVIVLSGTATVTATTNNCTAPRACSIAPAPLTYTVEDCETGTLWTMDTQGSQFALGDVIQYYANLTATGARYCGTIVPVSQPTANASLANAFVSYFCGDSIHCAQ